MNAFIVLTVGFLYLAHAVNALGLSSQDRLAEVKQKGRKVMPFSLEATVHIFSKTADGGLQQVIVKDKSGCGQIQFIRRHLSKISRDFEKGDFSGPMKIHGETMPGLAELRKVKPDQLNIRYQDLFNGAQISYSSKDGEVIQAIHDWFDAQLRDHGHHAIPGHHHHSVLP